VLFNEETKEDLTGYDKGQVTELGAVNVMTGIYTGRSPKDKFIVWTRERARTPFGGPLQNIRTTTSQLAKKTWAAVKKIAKKELSNKKLYVVDGFCGANKDTRMKVRFIMEVAWQAHFVTNMFIRPQSQEEFRPGARFRCLQRIQS
jgi:phosphoenolpyruvate carboxykinase (ATP)